MKRIALLLLVAGGLAGGWRYADRGPDLVPIGTTMVSEQVLQVEDGDTLTMVWQGKRWTIRFHGIDAFEYQQICHGPSQDMPCGRITREALVRAIGGITQACPSSRMHGSCLASSRPVQCQVTDTDRKWGRVVARCFSEAGRDLSAWLVASGYVQPAYSHDYDPLFAEARRNRRGFHEFGFFTPANSPAAARGG